MSARILAIDDSDHLREVLCLTLQFNGYAVQAAADGLDGLAAAHAEPFDLIICDIEMPRMDGIEFVRRYRLELGDQTPIIMLTAEGDELIQRARAAGANAVVTKPFEPMRLFAVIKDMLR